MAVDLTFRLLSPAIATTREALLPYADRARRLLQCAKGHPGCVRARWRPAQSHAHKIAETNHGAEVAPALPLIWRQAAANKAHREPRIAASAAAPVEAPTL